MLICSITWWITLNWTFQSSSLSESYHLQQTQDFSYLCSISCLSGTPFNWWYLVVSSKLTSQISPTTDLAVAIKKNLQSVTHAFLAKAVFILRVTVISSIPLCNKNFNQLQTLKDHSPSIEVGVDLAVVFKAPAQSLQISSQSASWHTWVYFQYIPARQVLGFVWGEEGTCNFRSL